MMRALIAIGRRVAKRHRIAVAGVILLAVPVACSSGEGIEAPTTLGAFETRPGDCPATATLTEDFHAARDDGKFVALAPHISKIVFEDGGIRVFARLLTQVLRQVDGRRLLDVMIGIDRGEGLARMELHIKNVLDYITGQGPLTAADQNPLLVGPHYGPVAATHRVLTRCDINATLSVTRRILELEVDVPDDDNGGVRRVPWIEPAFDALVAVAADPAFVALIADLELEDEEQGGGLRVGRDAFILIARLVTGNIAADNFDLAYLRGLLDDVLVLQLPEETGARERLAHLLDVFEVLLDPANDIFPFVQAFVQCVNAEDEAGTVPGMLYDYLTVDTLDYVEFLRDVDRLGDDAAGVPFREVSIAVLATLEEEPALTRDGLSIASRFIDAEVAPQTLPAVYDLVGTGVFTSAIALARAFIVDCHLATVADAGVGE